jgi:energy-coupling factor transport system ATP-binding protein
MPDPAAISLRAFSYRYPGAPAPALRDVDLEVRPGEFVVLAGRSGSGKSTLLRAACGLVPHFHGGDAAGEAVVCGLDVREHGPADLGAVVGLVAQEPEHQVVSATVRAELELPLEIRGEAPAARARAVEEVALALGIAPLLDRSTATLSGGELQRVALAAALVTRPRLVLLDEPTSQLDPVAGDELIGLLRRLNEEWGMGVVIAEHRLERCLPAADRAVAFAEGRVAFDGAPQEFLGWALSADAELATPIARMFAAAGLAPPPVSVKQARAALAGRRRRQDARAAEGRPAATGERALRVRGLTVRLEGAPLDALRDLTLELRAGERVALMGRNGAGKTTLMRSIAGLVEPRRGWAEAPRGFALVPQSPAAMLVRERVADEFEPGAASAALRPVGLEGMTERDPRDLSGGERQRLALALAMAGRDAAGVPGLVCMDEPTRGMDGARKRELAQWLERLAAAGAAVLVATHDVEFAARLADRVVLLGEGELLADGPAADVLSGGWYFATEVARALGVQGAVLPEHGARLIDARAGEEAGQ